MGPEDIFQAGKMGFLAVPKMEFTSYLLATCKKTRVFLGWVVLHFNYRTIARASMKIRYLAKLCQNCLVPNQGEFIVCYLLDY